MIGRKDVLPGVVADNWVDVEYLDSFQSFRDEARGFSERFLTPTLGGAPTVATLTEPLGHRRDVGWVICHSFGLEHVYLRTMESAFARAMAAAGFASLRFHGRGYGDGEFIADGVGPSTHVADALDAVALLTRETGLEDVGVAGARFGASVAAMVAARRRASGLILWDPVVSGKRYLNGLLQQTLLSGLTDADGPPTSTSSPTPTLTPKNGPADLQGIPLNERAHDELMGLNLADEVGSFAGRALVIQISRGAEPSADIGRLLTALRGSDASATFEHVVPGPKQRPFGGPPFRGHIDGTKVDTQRELQSSLIERAVGWADRSWSVSSDTGEEAP